MNTKFLVQTLIQIPDKQLLEELTIEITKNQSLMIPDLKRFYHMLSCLFDGTDKNIIMDAILLYQKTFKFLLRTDVQQSWYQISKSIIRLSGIEDAQLRKKGNQLMMQIIDITGNVNIVLQKLYYEGIQDQSVLVVISSIKNIYKILETYPGLLHNKTSINITKLILEKMMSLTLHANHIQLQKNARQFLDKLFYLKIQKLDQVLVLMNQVLLQRLEKIWAVNKQRMLFKEKQDEQKENQQYLEIKYEHLPLINGKFFGVFEIYIFKNLFNPELYTAKNLAIKHFRDVYQSHEKQLQKYVNVIFKVIVKFLPEEHYDLLYLLKKIVTTNGINNIVNLSVLPKILVGQLQTQQVTYRRDLREILKHLNFVLGKKCLKQYQESIRDNQISNWIKMNEILLLLEHWIDNNMQNSYPPALDSFLPVICGNLNSQHIKIKQKSLQLLVTILDRYPGYRQNLQNIFSQERIAQIQDIIESRKNKGKINPRTKEAEQIFMQEYQQERNRYMHFKNNQI